MSKAKWKKLQRELQAGINQLDRGEYVEISDTAAFAKDFVAKMHAKRAKKAKGKAEALSL